MHGEGDVRSDEVGVGVGLGKFSAVSRPCSAMPAVAELLFV